MKFNKIVICTMFLMLGGMHPVRASQIVFEYAFNVNGDVTSSLDGDVVIDGLDQNDFDPLTGIGTLSFTYNPGAAGAYYIAAFFDLELDEENNTWFNEIATVSGAAPESVSWEVDEPGYTFGDIYANFLNGSFDETNYFSNNGPEDVSVGLGWNFILAEEQYAQITYSILKNTPTSGFYINQSDPNSGESVYFTTSLKIIGDPIPGVPEPTTCSMLLLGSFLISMLAAKRRE